MKFNYEVEKARFLAEWKKEENILRSQNVSEDIMKQIYDFSWKQFKSDRNYYLHKEEVSRETDLSVEMDLDENLSFLDNVENPMLLKALGTLNYNDLEIIMLSAKGIKEREIAERKGQSQSNISQKITRDRKSVV